jgi:hypothetical protein
MAGRQEEFLAVLRDEIAHRLESLADDERFGSLLLQIKRGEIDPYRAALEFVGSEEAVRAVLRSPGAGES